jgi:hypothetical protein
VKDHPELEFFERWWPVEDLMKQYLKNTSDKAREIDKRHSKRMGAEPKLMNKKSKSGASMTQKTTPDPKNRKLKASGTKSMHTPAGKSKKTTAAAATASSQAASKLLLKGPNNASKAKGKSRGTLQKTTNCSANVKAFYEHLELNVLTQVPLDQEERV